MKTNQRYAAGSRHLKKHYLSWHLKILRHAHTGHLVHRQHTSYPVIAFLLLVFGVFLWTWTNEANAASINVSAVVSGPPPTVPATIDSPTSGSTFDATPITVSGTCPTSTYVQIFRNSVAGGTALCSSSGTYNLQTDLFVGNNSLIVRDYDYVNQAGPDSQPVNVTYTPATPSPIDQQNPSEPSSSSSPASVVPPATQEVSNPLLLKTDYVYQGVNVGDEADWAVTISGGVAPYSVHVDWGDTEQSLYTVKTASVLHLRHTYKQAGGYQGSYVVKVNSTDSVGASAFLQILAIVNGVPAGPVAGGTGNIHGGGAPVTPLGLLKQAFTGATTYAWVGYILCFLMLLSFWLGEVRELRLIRRRPSVRV